MTDAPTRTIPYIPVVAHIAQPTVVVNRLSQPIALVNGITRRPLAPGQSVSLTEGVFEIVPGYWQDHPATRAAMENE